MRTGWFAASPASFEVMPWTTNDSLIPCAAQANDGAGSVIDLTQHATGPGHILTAALALGAPSPGCGRDPLRVHKFEHPGGMAPWTRVMARAGTNRAAPRQRPESWSELGRSSRTSPTAVACRTSRSWARLAIVICGPCAAMSHARSLISGARPPNWDCSPLPRAETERAGVRAPHAKSANALPRAAGHGSPDGGAERLLGD